jgi:hypothetical protein
VLLLLNALRTPAAAALRTHMLLRVLLDCHTAAAARERQTLLQCGDPAAAAGRENAC